MTDDSNVLRFEPKSKEAPALHSVELRLRDETCDLEMTIYDASGNVAVVIEYDIASRWPKDFDMDLLRQAWDRWRGFSELAS